jgi:hypothetical protein
MCSPAIGQFQFGLPAKSTNSWPAQVGLFRSASWIFDSNASYLYDVGDEVITGYAGPFSLASQPGDIPVTGDWNGDGHEKAGIFRHGYWILDSDGKGTLKTFRYTNTDGDLPVVGNWDGEANGRMKTGVYRTSPAQVGVWILDVKGDGNPNYADQGVAFQYTASPGDIPVVGDWNKDRHTKTGVFRSGLWILDRDGTCEPTAPQYQVSCQQWQTKLVNQYTATAGDIPILGRWRQNDDTTYTGIYRQGDPAQSYAGVGLWILNTTNQVINWNNLCDPNAPNNYPPTIDQTGHPPCNQVFQYTATVGDTPIIGDWTGDGRMKTGIYRIASVGYPLDSGSRYQLWLRQ